MSTFGMCALSLGLEWFSVAQANPVMVYMPLHGYVASPDLLVGAESLAVEELNRLLSQGVSSESEFIQVSVLGDRNGELIPLLTTVVSPAQWQQAPQLSRWTRYYDSYALIRRHDEELVARVPVTDDRSGAAAGLSESRLRQIEGAYDAGTLSGDVAQDYLDELD